MKLLEINKMAGVVASLIMTQKGEILESTMMGDIDGASLSNTVEKLYTKILKYVTNINSSGKINDILIDSKGQGKIFIANLKDNTIIAVIADANINIGMLKLEIQNI
jgi:predicted regulator of Ras-like GTPase activity (Roadblock/LC7/MglB family)